MAIGKWIPFSGTPNATADNQTVKSATVQVISSADAKKFGLENVSLLSSFDAFLGGS
jgi:hypothetical protein